MARVVGIPDETFAAMQRIRDTALVQFNSLFTPERKLWSLENLRRFHALFVERFDLGEGSFLEKWRKQLEEADHDILQLAAELLYVQQFFTRVTGPERKLENVRTVLAWCGEPPSIPEWAVKGVNHGISRDQSFNQHRPFHLAWLNEFLIHWQELPLTDQEELLSDPWRFAQDVRSVVFSHGAYQPMLEAWLYIAFPDSFENISSKPAKLRIRESFSDRLHNGPSGNIDLDLFEIRKSLTSQYGEGFHFYLSPIVEQWNQANITEHDIDLIRQSRSRDRYADFSGEERAAYKRVHDALRQFGGIATDELGGPRDYVRKLTAGFHPNSGIRGGKPKDLWFGVYRKENEERYLGNPQIFMIVSSRGVEWGFSPLTHPDDFSNQDLRRETRQIAKSVLEQLPAPDSTEAESLAEQLAKSGNWKFRRKQRLEPNQSEFESLEEWLAFLRSDEGARNAGGGIARYAVGPEIDEIDFPEAVREMAELFRPLMERVVADAPPATATKEEAQITPTTKSDATLPAFRNLLQTFVQELSKARNGPFQKTTPLWDAMFAVKSRLEQFPAVSNRPDLLVNISVGQGNWATVPWIALLNTRITQSTQEGIYVVFLITNNLDRIFLTLNQGTTNLVRELGQPEAQKRMLDVASKTRGTVSNLAALGFLLDNKIELGGGGWLAKNYEIGTIVHIDFKTNELPDDKRINELLEALLDAYDRTVDAPAAEVSGAETVKAEAPPHTEPYAMDHALSELFEQSSLERLLAIWEGKKNLILLGAPGVGKSFVAKRLAYLLLGERTRVALKAFNFTSHTATRISYKATVLMEGEDLYCVTAFSIAFVKRRPCHQIASMFLSSTK
jgi:MrcB-like, N-terminal domain/Magnesium chelatase, subunit ChlI